MVRNDTIRTIPWGIGVWCHQLMPIRTRIPVELKPKCFDFQPKWVVWPGEPHSSSETRRFAVLSSRKPPAAARHMSVGKRARVRVEGVGAAPPTEGRHGAGAPCPRTCSGHTHRLRKSTEAKPRAALCAPCGVCAPVVSRLAPPGILHTLRTLRVRGRVHGWREACAVLCIAMIAF